MAPRSPAALFWFFCYNFRVAGTQWPRESAYNNGGLHSTSSLLVAVAAHTPCQGTADGSGRSTLRYGRSDRRACAPQGAEACEADLDDFVFRCAEFCEALVSCFTTLPHGVSIPMRQLVSFRVSRGITCTLPARCAHRVTY